MITYYRRVYIEEHMLMCGEIADKYGILSKSNKPHSRLITDLIYDYWNTQNVEIPEYYYSSMRMNRVYPKDFYHDPIKWLVRSIKTEGEHSFLINGIVYKFIYEDRQKILSNS